METTYTPKLKDIEEDKRRHSSTRRLAVQMQLRPYITVGQFFEDCSAKEVEELNDMVATIEENEDGGMELTLLTVMLGHASGITLVAGDIKFQTDLINAFCLLVTIEMLWHKGLVDVRRENYSLDFDAPNKEICKLKGQ